MTYSRRSLLGTAAGAMAGWAAARGTARAQGAAPARTTLRFATINGETTPAYTDILLPFAKGVEAGAGGALEVALRPLGVYGKPVDLFNMVERGDIEIAGTVQGYTPGRFPQSSVMELPLMFDTGVAGTRVMNTLLKEGLLDRDYAAVKVLALYLLPPYGIFSATKPVKQLRDLRGMRVRSPSTTVGLALARMGMIPLGVPLNLIGDSLASGTVDAITYGWDSLMSRGAGDKLLADQVSVLVDANFAAPALMIVMNRKAFEALPAEHQALIEHEARDMAMQSARMRDASEMATKKRIIAEGRHTVVELTAGQRAEMEKLIAPAINDWKAGMAKQGIDGEALYARAKALGRQFQTAAQ